MRYVDSHTEGEPTRVIVEGGPDLGSGITGRAFICAEGELVQQPGDPFAQGIA